MAGRERDPLITCPRGCGYMVPSSRRGQAHQYPDPKNSAKLITCKDS